MRRLDLYRNDAGLHENVPGQMVAPGFTPDASNVDIDRDGRLSLPRMGTVRQVASPLASGKVNGLWRLGRRDGTWALVAVCNNTAYKISATGTATSLGTANGATDEMRSAVSYFGKLFIASGRAVPQVYETELEDLDDLEGATLPQAWENGNWPGHMTLINAGANERLAAWGFQRDRSRVYFSALQDYLDWTTEEDAFSLVPAEDDNELAVSVFSFYDKLVINKETRTHIYQGVDATTGEIAKYDNIRGGSMAHSSVVYTGQDVLWLGPDGFMSMRTVQEYGDVATQVLNSRIQASLKKISPTRAKQTVGYWDAEYQRARWFVPARSSYKNALIFDYYPDRRYKDSSGYTTGAWMVGEGINASCVVSFPSAGRPIVLAGDYDGYINRLNAGHQDLGDDIASNYSFPKLDLGNRGRLPFLDFMVSAGGDALQAQVSIDDATAVAMAGDLAPTFPGDAAPARARKVHYGAGHHFRPIVAHTGGDTQAILDGVSLTISPLGGR